MKQYDLIVVGGGIGGYTAALKAAKNGLSVALIEKNEWGGTCLNRGCIPTKAFVHSSELFRAASQGERFGILCEPKADFTKIAAYRDGVVRRLREGLIGTLENAGIEMLSDEAEFADENVLYLKRTDRWIKGDDIVLAVGSKPYLPDIEGIEFAHVSDDLLQQNLSIPDNILIIGGGVIGAEFASAFRGFGKKVTIAEMTDRILGGFDGDVSQYIASLFRRDKTEILTRAAAKKIRKAEKGFDVLFETPSGETVVNTEFVLFSAGRIPNLEGLHLKKANVAYSPKGIATDENFLTSNCHVYAVGDCNGKIQLAHAAAAQAEAATDYLLGIREGKDLSAMPRCVYTSLEIAETGRNETQCKREGIDYTAGKAPLSGNGKCVIGGKDRGFAKILFEKGSGRVLGASLLCDRATDLIGELTLAVVGRLTREDILKTVYPHPTVCEILTECARNAQ